MIAQLPALPSGAIETWLLSAAAVLVIVGFGIKLFVRKPPLEAEFVTKEEFRIFRAAVAGDRPVAFQVGGADPVDGGNAEPAGDRGAIRQLAVGRNRFSAKQVVAEAEEHHFRAGKFAGLVNRVPVALLLVLHGEG